MLHSPDLTMAVASVPYPTFSLAYHCSASKTLIQSTQLDMCCRYDFFYHLLQHGENIIIMPPLGEPSHVTQNLTQVVRILAENDAKAEEIGLQAQYLMQSIFGPDSIREYWLRLLTEYAKLMKFRP